MASAATEIASTIQSAHIKKHPSPEHDINPSTAASKKLPGEVETISPPRSRSHSLSGSSESTIPSDIIRPRPRTRSFPPIPDFRFEQSYLASIKTADSNWRIAFITIRDQVFLPLVQGILWNLVMFGWRHWNRGSKFQGQSLGAKVRKWWWGVNNWKIPGTMGADAKGVKKQSDRQVLQRVEDFFVDRFGTSLGD
ncbi:uncharacterized protein Z520_07610 [Fonsecaea multimorphosa CBS 102226]|uniref:DUF1770-domain-containing protein n=1 Tax=Fonsecaea multimorphosa CBS 102226 TaxID=1442371 RepID=A0A0D2H4Z7_9EURO|nr:uncharacterized protein Z520_07610 [Fonsecaea multimorphosa CBS 102226]KIX96890.1 hypothetical protein Z520_07610 [Fonsecaea multimorphosa CBS 102226]OAL22567.1 hypothetical protein AYO22_07125 [Fonsecaea multimorphosa]